MKKNIASHWSYLMTGPTLALVLIFFWYANESYLAQGKSPAVILLENPLLTFGIIMFGAHVGALFGNEFRITLPRRADVIISFFAGIVMGIGAVCASMSVHSVVLFNLAGIFNLTACMAVKGWIYGACMVCGGWCGSKLLVYYARRNCRQSDRGASSDIFVQKKYHAIIFYTCVGIFFILVAAIVILSPLAMSAKYNFAITVFGLMVFGMIVERGTICMSSMLKEWFIAHSGYVWRSVLFTVMSLALVYQVGIGLALFKPIAIEPYVHNIGMLMVGSFLMGFGFIFADGCFIGCLWKAGQGNCIAMTAILGILIGIGGMRSVMPATVGHGSDVLPNDMSIFIHPLLFLLLIWIAGLALFIAIKVKRYRY